jgi:hypothetical protein
MGANTFAGLKINFLLLVCFLFISVIMSNVFMVLHEKLTNTVTNPPTVIGLYFYFLFFVFPTQILGLLIIYFGYYLFSKYFVVRFFYQNKKYVLFVFCSIILGIIYSVVMHVLFLKISYKSSEIFTGSLLKNLNSAFFYFSFTSIVLITMLWTITMNRIRRQ